MELVVVLVVVLVVLVGLHSSHIVLPLQPRKDQTRSMVFS